MPAAGKALVLDPYRPRVMPLHLPGFRTLKGAAPRAWDDPRAEVELSPIKDIELRASRIPGVVSLAQGSRASTPRADHTVRAAEDRRGAVPANTPSPRACRSCVN